MRFDKFTIKAQEAVHEAQELAESKRQQQILAVHLLEVLLTQEQGIVVPLLKKLGIDTKIILDKTLATVNKLPQISGSGAPGQAYVSAELRDTFNLAWEEASKLKDEYVSTEHLLLALVG
ncbi:MAG TPA: Clp protease N-terminal domain-containing protein, partial [Candidatus Brocadiaceae bacterium]|nr:Clp protease N-terminal domain-containing protein [Candidatus Brocadiaceae bacterium]